MGLWLRSRSALWTGRAGGDLDQVSSAAASVKIFARLMFRCMCRLATVSCLKMGRWDNLIGYESNDAYKNDNFTRSYAWSVEPTEHTGVLANINLRRRDVRGRRGEHRYNWAD